MPTTRSGAHYGSSDPKSTTAGKQAPVNKRKAAVKTYTKAKSQASKTKPTLKVKQDSGKKKTSKKVVQYNKPPVKGSATRAQKIQGAAKRRVESVDKKRFRGPRLHQTDEQEASKVYSYSTNRSFSRSKCEGILQKHRQSTL